jgi:hypothetical protein
MSRGVLERLILEVSLPNLDRVALVEKLHGPLRFDVAARLHGKCRLSSQHGTLKLLYRALIAINTGMLKQLPKIFSQLGPIALSRHQLHLPQFLEGCKFHSIRREPILDKPRAKPLRRGVICKHCYKYCAHGWVASSSSEFLGIACGRRRL